MAVPAPFVCADASTVLSNKTSIEAFFSNPVACTLTVSPGAAVDVESSTLGVLSFGGPIAPSSAVPVTISNTATIAPAMPPAKTCFRLLIGTSPSAAPSTGIR